jgi:hypothetical protein
VGPPLIVGQSQQCTPEPARQNSSARPVLERLDWHADTQLASLVQHLSIAVVPRLALAGDLQESGAVATESANLVGTALQEPEVRGQARTVQQADRIVSDRNEPLRAIAGCFTVKPSIRLLKS